MAFAIKLSSDKGVPSVTMYIEFGIKIQHKIDFIEVSLRHKSVDLFYQKVDEKGKLYKSASFINLPFSDAFASIPGCHFLIRTAILELLGLQVHNPSSATSRLVHYNLRNMLIKLVSLDVTEVDKIQSFGRFPHQHFYIINSLPKSLNHDGKVLE